MSVRRQNRSKRGHRESLRGGTTRNFPAHWNIPRPPQARATFLRKLGDSLMAFTRRSTAVAAALALATSPALAVVYSVDLTLPTNNYGTVDQRNVTSPNYPSFNNGGNACGPTSVVNSFT